MTDPVDTDALYTLANSVRTAGVLKQVLAWEDAEKVDGALRDAAEEIAMLRANTTDHDWVDRRDTAYMHWIRENHGAKTAAERLAFMEGFYYAASREWGRDD